MNGLMIFCKYLSKLNMLLTLTKTFLRDFISQKGTIKHEKLQNQNKDNKISPGRGNSLRNKVRGWVELDSPNPLKPFPANNCHSFF